MNRIEYNGLSVVMLSNNLLEAIARPGHRIEALLRIAKHLPLAR
jgi:hypothetical protein